MGKMHPCLCPIKWIPNCFAREGHNMLYICIVYLSVCFYITESQAGRNWTRQKMWSNKCSEESWIVKCLSGQMASVLVWFVDEISHAVKPTFTCDAARQTFNAFEITSRPAVLRAPVDNLACRCLILPPVASRYSRSSCCHLSEREVTIHLRNPLSSWS